MKFKKEMLQELAYDDCIDAERIENTIIESTRWSIIYTMIFKYENKFYRSHYSMGATEMQEEKPYEYDAAEIDCPEVIAHEITAIVWRPILK